jgi:UDP-GlcNAc:undecaprenyl-phosphate GlcNAc-1-phosphate transferase
MLKLNFVKIIQIVLTLPISFFLTKLSIDISKKIGFVNNPNPIVESHKVTTAYGGGAAIGLTIIIFLIFQAVDFYYTVEFILILLPVIAVGLFDDIIKFSTFVKLTLQLFSAFPFLLFYIDCSISILPIFLLIILISQNAWNLIDIMDGLTAGITFIIFSSMGLILTSNSELVFYSSLSFAVAFSTLGFRFLNRTPAIIFLGETGSLLLGSLFAFIVISTFLVSETIACYLFLLGSIPFFELFFLIIVRTKKGIPFYKASPDHFALRMLNNGFSVQTINRRVMLVCSIHSLIIVVASFVTSNLSTLIICICLNLIAAAGGYLYFQTLPAREHTQRV